MGLRERIGRALLGSQINELEEAFNTVALAYRVGQYTMTPETLLTRLDEYDSYLADIIMRQRGYDTITGQGMFGLQFTEMDRLNVVEQTRFAYHYDPQCGRAVNAWTDFGFGQRAIIEPLDEGLLLLWDEFWSARRNSCVIRKLHESSNKIITDGEVFFIFFASRIGAEPITVRRLLTEEIKSIIALPSDPDTPLYYVRDTTDGTVWYPDWAATPEQLDAIEIPDGVQRADSINETTDVRAMRVSYSDINGRGWPTIYRAIPWYEAYKEFLQDRAAVASIIARTARKIKHKGGSLATAGIKAQLQSSLVNTGYGNDTNPPPVAGSPLIMNDAMDMESMDLTTGATDAQKDSIAILGQATAGDGFPIGYRGRPDSAQNRSVAEVTTRPWEYQMDRYGGVWADALRDMVEIVARFYEMYGRKTFSTYEANVSLNRPISTDPQDLSATMSEVQSATVNGVMDYRRGQAVYSALVDVTLERYGIDVEDTAIQDESEAVRMAAESWRDGRISSSEYAEFLYEIGRDRERDE